MKSATTWAASPAIPLAALLIVGVSLFALPAFADPPTFTADSTTIEASEELVWNTFFTIDNRLDTGFYLDSLFLDVEDLGPIEPGRQKRQSSDISNVLRTLDGISARDAAGIQVSSPATCETATLTFRLLGHDANKVPYRFSAEVHALPGPYSRSFPSESLTVGGKRVEYLLIPARDAGPSAPAVLLVHDHGSSARRMLSQAIMLSARGNVVALVSQPGYGGSQGPADWCGPATLAAVGAVFDRMKRADGVDSTRLAVWGFGRGATAAALLASRRKDVRVLVAQSGVYDLAGASRGANGAELRQQIIAEAGKDSAAWRKRSPAYEVSHLTASTLVLHGEKDMVAPASQARAYMAKAKAADHIAEGQFFPTAGNSLPMGAVSRAVTEFLKRQLKE